ncbi:hypothetical protein GCM10010276_24630 [Streptomyces longisporus]|uniref:Uncharacterized protein n=1 Tax=Streptomyces longisporus TaxID=1948 RepID=A0ABP5YRG3_STRLO
MCQAGVSRPGWAVVPVRMVSAVPGSVVCLLRAVSIGEGLEGLGWGDRRVSGGVVAGVAGAVCQAGVSRPGWAAVPVRMVSAVPGSVVCLLRAVSIGGGREGLGGEIAECRVVWLGVLRERCVRPE